MVNVVKLIELLVLTFLCVFTILLFVCLFTSCLKFYNYVLG